MTIIKILQTPPPMQPTGVPQTGMHNNHVAYSKTPEIYISYSLKTVERVSHAC